MERVCYLQLFLGTGDQLDGGTGTCGDTFMTDLKTNISRGKTAERANARDMESLFCIYKDERQ